MKLRKTFGIIFALGTLFALIPNALALTKMFQVHTLSGGSLTTSLVSYYPMQGNSNDYWGTNNGTDTSMSYGNTYGKVNEGGDFGSASNITTSLWLSSNSVFSYAFWVYVPNNNLTGIFLSNGNNNDITGSGVAVGVGASGAGAGANPAFGAGTGNALIVLSGGVAWQYSTTGIGTGWHFIVVTRDGTTMKAYIDTVQTSALASATAVPNTPSGNSWFDTGSTSNQFTNFVGYMDEVGIWSKALSTQEITDLYNGGAGQTMCNGTGGPLCSTPRHHVILISLNWKPEPIAWV